MFSFLTDLGVSKQAINCLIGRALPSDIDSDLSSLLEALIYFDRVNFSKEYNTYLWTLLGEISIPAQVSPDLNTEWPLLIFPFENTPTTFERIEEFLQQHDCEIVKTRCVFISELLHACLYGGQAWYDSLRPLYHTMAGDYGRHSTLLWFDKKREGAWDVVSVAKMLQTQLRPKMRSIENKPAGGLYPGVIKAFHTPSINNILIHKHLLSMDIWEDCGI